MPEPSETLVTLHLEDGSTVIVGIKPNPDRLDGARYQIYSDSRGRWRTGRRGSSLWVTANITPDHLRRTAIRPSDGAYFWRALKPALEQLGYNPDPSRRS